MTACNKSHNDCQKGQPILFEMFWVLFYTFWFCLCTTHYNRFWQLCGWNFRSLNVFLLPILLQFWWWLTLMAWICAQLHSAIWFAVDVAVVNMSHKWHCVLHCHYMLIWSLMVSNKSCLPYHWLKDSKTIFWSPSVCLPHVHVFLFAAFLRADLVFYLQSWQYGDATFLTDYSAAKDWKNCFTKQKKTEKNFYRYQISL